jgi:hypothetical protein
VQEVLSAAFDKNPITLAPFAHLHINQDARYIQLRLAEVLRSANEILEYGMPEKLRKRQFFQSNRVGRNEAIKKIVSNGSWMIKIMSDSCLNFDYSVFLERLGGNWPLMWNSMVSFFRRGMYFEKPYPPMHDIYDTYINQKEIVPFEYYLKEISPMMEFTPSSDYKKRKRNHDVTRKDKES